MILQNDREKSGDKDKYGLQVALNSKQVRKLSQLQGKYCCKDSNEDRSQRFTEKELGKKVPCVSQQTARLVGKPLKIIR